MKRPFLSALLCLPLAALGCAPEDDADPLADDPLADDAVAGDVDGDATAIVTGSGSSTVGLDTFPAVADAGDFAGQVVFSVPDMHCPYSCAPAVKGTLASMPGISEVETDADARTVTFKAGEGFDLAAAKAALADKNFPVDNVTM